MNNNYKEQNWIVAYLLTLVTCGIYMFYMIGYVGTATNNEGARYGFKQTINPVLAIVLGFVTCGIVPIVWYYQYFDLQVKIAKARGIQVAPSDSPVVLTILMFIPFYSYYVLCDNFNKVIAK